MTDLLSFLFSLLSSFFSGPSIPAGLLMVKADPGTILFLMGAGAIVSAIGSINQGGMVNEISEEQASHNEEIAKKQYGLSKTEATAQLEELRTEEKKARGGLLQGAAHSGIKIERDQIQDVSRTDTGKLIADMGLDETQYGKPIPRTLVNIDNEDMKDRGYSGGTNGEARNTLEALSNEISRQITNEEKSVMRNLSSARLGLEDALFNAKMLREKGQMAQIAGWFDAGSTLLTSGAGIYSSGKNWGVW